MKTEDVIAASSVSQNGSAAPQDAPPLALGLLLALCGLKMTVHLLTGGQYGYFRDELYFLDCGRHLAWGYVDHAPMIGLVARCASLLGGSLHALRLFPALAGAALVGLSMLITHRLGGGRFAQGLTGLAVLIVPIYLGIDSILSMNAFEPLFWMGCIYALIRRFQTGNPRLWLVFGLLTGLGLMNKHSTLFFAFAVVAGLILTRERREFLKPWIWIGGALALLIFLPNLLWQIQHNFPTLEDLRNVSSSNKNIVLSPVEFIGQQILVIHPVLLPLWLAGLWYFLAGAGKRFRCIGWTYLILLGIFIILKGKNYYLAPIYPMLFAGGSVAVEAWLGHRTSSRKRLWPQAAIVFVLLAAGIVSAPLMLPVLPPEGYVAYEATLGLTPPKTEVDHRGPLPQLFGDQFGWEELVGEVARIYNALPTEERAKAGIWAGNYGEAGAINLFGPRHGLPAAISSHQTYFFWGPRDYTGEILIVLQRSRPYLERNCRSVEEVGKHFHPWGMEEENRPIYLCRDTRIPLPELWPQLKHWN